MASNNEMSANETEAMSQDIQTETITKPSPEGTDKNVSVTETDAVVPQEEKTDDTDPEEKDTAEEIAHGTNEEVRNTNDKDEDDSALEAKTEVKSDIVMEKVGDDGVVPTDASTVDANSEKGKEFNAEMIKGDTSKEEGKEVKNENSHKDSKEDAVVDPKEEAIEEIGKNTIEEVKVGEVKGDIEGKEHSDKVKEDVREDTPRDVKEDAAEDVKENSSEDVEEKGAENIEENVEEKGAEDVEEDAVENVEGNADEEIKDISKEEHDNESTVTPSKAKRKRSKKVVESPNLSRSGTKRERKAADHFEPGNFKAEQRQRHTSAVKPGRGTILKEIPQIKFNIEKSSVKDPSLAASHKFVYGGRGIVAKKLIKKQLFEFSGFLPADADGQEKVEDDNAILEKMKVRAQKMTVPLLKTICDIFDVDRQPEAGRAVLDKEGIIDKLLTFLASPDVKLTNRGKPKTKKRGRPSISKSPKPKKSKKSEVAEEVDVDDEEMEEEVNYENDEEEDADGTPGKKMPSKKELRKFVKAYVTCFSMEKTTTKHLIQTASDKFDVDVASKKKDILELLTHEMPTD